MRFCSEAWAPTGPEGLHRGASAHSESPTHHLNVDFAAVGSDRGAGTEHQRHRTDRPRPGKCFHDDHHNSGAGSSCVAAARGQTLVTQRISCSCFYRACCLAVWWLFQAAADSQADCRRRCLTVEPSVFCAADSSLSLDANTPAALQKRVAPTGEGKSAAEPPGSSVQAGEALPPVCLPAQGSSWSSRNRSTTSPTSRARRPRCTAG